MRRLSGVRLNYLLNRVYSETGDVSRAYSKLLERAADSGNTKTESIPSSDITSQPEDDSVSVVGCYPNTGNVRDNFLLFGRVNVDVRCGNQRS